MVNAIKRLQVKSLQFLPSFYTALLAHSTCYLENISLQKIEHKIYQPGTDVFFKMSHIKIWFVLKPSEVYVKL